MDPNHVLKHSSTASLCLWRFAVVKSKSQEEYLPKHPMQTRQSANLDTKTFRIAEDFQIRKHCTFFKKRTGLRYVYKTLNMFPELSDPEVIKFILVEFIRLVLEA